MEVIYIRDCKREVANEGLQSYTWLPENGLGYLLLMMIGSRHEIHPRTRVQEESP